MRRVPRQLRRIDGSYATVCGGTAADAVQEGLIDVDAFLIFGGRTVEDTGSAAAGGQSVTGTLGGRSQRAIIGNVIERADGSRRATADDCHQSRERIGRLGSRRIEVVDTIGPQGSEVWAVRHAAIGAGDAVRAIDEVDGVHAVDADQQNVLDGAVSQTRGVVSLAACGRG